MTTFSLRDRLRRLRAAWHDTAPAAAPEVRAVEHALLAAERRIAALTTRLTAAEDELLRLRHASRLTPHASDPSNPPSSILYPQSSIPRLALFTPIGPQPTGIAAYSEMLLPALAHLAEVDLYLDEPTPTDPFVQQQPRFAPHDYPERRRKRAYDATIYQMGNNAQFHAAMYAMLVRYPGIVILHEFLLHHFIAGYTIDHADREAYPWEVGYGEGPAAMAEARAALRGERPFPFFDYPLVAHILDLSQGVLCHSEFVRRQVGALRPELPVAVVGLPTTVTMTAPPRPADAPFTVITAGYMTPAKGLLPALEGFARFARTHPNARYLLVGAVEPGFDLDGWIHQSGVGHQVERCGYAPTLAEFDQHIAQADVCLNLRYPTAGETSASLLRVMGVGVPAIVSDTGWFSEIPDSVCVKTAVPPSSEDVATALTALAQDTPRRRAMAAAAAQWVETVHSPTAAAKGYMAFIESYK